MREALGHPVDQASTQNNIQPTNPKLTPEHTGSIFGGLKLDEEDYADYDYEEAASSTVITEHPLPAGPTRKPGQAVPLPLRQEKTDNAALSQLANLPLLTTKRPTILHGTTRKPRTHFGEVFSSGGQIGSLLVHSSMDIVDQTHLFSKMDPFQEQFIAPPRVNAGIMNYSGQKFWIIR